MSDPPRPRCNGTPAHMCGERRAAMRAGEMFFSAHYLGWIYPAEDRHVPHALTRGGIVPMTWPFCPFCSGPLPTFSDAVQRIIDDEEGG